MYDKRHLLQIIRYMIGDCNEIINIRKSLWLGYQNPENIVQFIEESIAYARKSSNEWEKALNKFKMERK